MGTPNLLTRIVGEIAKLADATGKYDSVTRGSKQVSRQLIRETYQIATIAAAANGSTDTTANATTMWRAPANGRVLGAYFHPTADATAEATNYVKIELHRLTGAGGAGTMIANFSTAATNVTKATPFALTLDGPNANFTKGQCLAPFIDQAGAGVALAAGAISFRVEYEDIDDFGV